MYQPRVEALAAADRDLARLRPCPSRCSRGRAPAAASRRAGRPASPASIGSPNLSFLTSSVSASTTSSYFARDARMRVCATHAWPLFIIDAGTRPGIAVATSASSRMIAADFPPSSSVKRRSRSPQSCAMCRPTAVLPVNADLVDAGMGDEVLADLASGRDDVDDAFGDAGLLRRTRRAGTRRAASRARA